MPPIPSLRKELEFSRLNHKLLVTGGTASSFLEVITLHCVTLQVITRLNGGGVIKDIQTAFECLVRGDGIKFQTEVGVNWNMVHTYCC